MPRDIPVGNGHLLITFDSRYRIRDIYSPQVGRHNHTDGHIQRFGVWADGVIAWVDDDAWERRLAYRTGTLVTDVLLRHPGLGLELTCHDCVDFHEPVYFRRCHVRDLKGKQRDVRLFFHWDLSINGFAVGDTANYDPQTQAVILYKDDSYFLINACDAHTCGVSHWAIGHKRMNAMEGTWRDAEDGLLGRNEITQGSVDCTVGVHLDVPAGGECAGTLWLATGTSYADVRSRSDRVWEKGPERLIARTDAYWKLWCRKESPAAVDPLPPRIRELLTRSLLIVRSQIDNGGAIIAANDSDITQFGGDHYSYCWMRDGALVVDALIQSGQSELSRSFFRFADRCIEDAGYFLHKYTPRGDLASSWHPWTIDGERVLPIQQDETALVVWALRRHFERFRDVEFIKPLYSRLVVAPAEWMLAYRDHNGLPRPSWDLWEERRGVHTFTVATVIGGLFAAAEFAEDFGERDRAAAFREGAERMKGALRRHLWNESAGRFARMATPLGDGGYRLDMTHDSANFALFAIAGIDARDPMVTAEMEALHDRLWIKTPIGGCARYENDYYHQVEFDDTDAVPGNPWAICTLWHAHWRVERARSIEELTDALPLLEWAADRAAVSGVLAEQYHPRTGAPISVSPLTWSHSTFVAVCGRYLAKHAALAAVSGPVAAGSAPESIAGPSQKAGLEPERGGEVRAHIA